MADQPVACLPAGVGGLHLVRVPAVGPEEEQPVKQRRDVGHVRLPLWKDPEDAAVLLINNAAMSETLLGSSDMLVIGGRTHLRPVLVEVVDARDAAPVTVRIVHVFDVAGPVSRVTRHHGLNTHGEQSQTKSTFGLYFLL